MNTHKILAGENPTYAEITIPRTFAANHPLFAKAHVQTHAVILEADAFSLHFSHGNVVVTTKGESENIHETVYAHEEGKLTKKGSGTPHTCDNLNQLVQHYIQTKDLIVRCNGKTVRIPQSTRLTLPDIYTIGNTDATYVLKPDPSLSYPHLVINVTAKGEFKLITMLGKGLQKAKPLSTAEVDNLPKTLETNKPTPRDLTADSPERPKPTVRTHTTVIDDDTDDTIPTGDQIIFTQSHPGVIGNDIAKYLIAGQVMEGTIKATHSTPKHERYITCTFPTQIDFTGKPVKTETIRITITQTRTQAEETLATKMKSKLKEAIEGDTIVADQTIETIPGHAGSGAADSRQNSHARPSDPPPF